MGTLIPTKSRLQVASRDGKQCVRCGSQRGLHWHHRRTRRVRDEHTHCACNGVSLCTTCHAWTHAHPNEALHIGLIVSRYSKQPGLSSVSVLQWGRVLLTCGGGFELSPRGEVPDARTM